LRSVSKINRSIGYPIHSGILLSKREIQVWLGVAFLELLTELKVTLALELFDSSFRDYDDQKNPNVLRLPILEYSTVSPLRVRQKGRTGKTGSDLLLQLAQSTIET
jgi:hypothetical protein